MLCRRRIDSLNKTRDCGLHILQQLQAAHGEACEAKQAACADCDVHETATQEMLVRDKGFGVGEYLDRQSYAGILMERLNQANSKVKAAAEAEQAQECELEALRTQINRQGARMSWLKERLDEAVRMHEDLLQEAEEEEIGETSTARRRMENCVRSREQKVA
jgi:hypothetical protein